MAWNSVQMTWNPPVNAGFPLSEQTKKHKHLSKKKQNRNFLQSFWRLVCITTELVFCFSYVARLIETRVLCLFQFCFCSRKQTRRKLNRPRLVENRHKGNKSISIKCQCRFSTKRTVQFMLYQTWKMQTKMQLLCPLHCQFSRSL